MALSNLVTEKLEQYGGIDLKRNSQKFFRNALGISIGLHCLVILLYWGWTAFSNDDSHAPHVRVRSISDLAQPPSTQDKPDEAQPVTPPPPSDVVKPNLGIPVPVPDAIAPQLTLPDMNQAPPPTAAVASNGPVTTETPNLVIQTPVEEKDPSIDDFVDVTDEPAPIIPIEKLIVYPEVAKRSGLEGKVTVEALIRKDGTVKECKVIKSDYDVFKDAAVAAVMKAKFTPARQNGTPLSIWITRQITFKLVNR